MAGLAAVESTIPFGVIGGISMETLEISAARYYRHAQYLTALQTNARIVEMYWNFGQAIADRKTEKSLAFYRTLSRDLLAAAPAAKLLTASSLQFAEQFFLTYRTAVTDDLSLMQDLKHLTWLHHRVILRHCRTDTEQTVAWVRQVISQNLSVRVLRDRLMGTQESPVAEECSLTSDLLCNSYALEYLGIREEHNDFCVREALKTKVIDALLKARQGWAFVGKDVCLTVGKTELWLDLLFYQLKRRCYTVALVLPTAFDASSWGLLGTQVAAVDHQMRDPQRDEATQGLLVCRSQEAETVQYAREAGSEALSVMEFDDAALKTEEIDGYLPTIEEVEKLL